MAAVETRSEVRAQAKWVRSSARKARLVTDLIRGRSVPEARTILAFSERAVARDIEKVLRSAVANAEANHGLAGDDLVLVAAYADEGPTLKRVKPRARGRVNRIFKRTCHITIKLATPDGAVVTTTRAAAAAPAEAPKRARTQKPSEEKPKTTRAKKSDDAAAEEKPKRAPRAKKTDTEKTPKRKTQKKSEES